MKKLFLCLLLVSPLTFAVGEKTFTWQPPTEYDDDTPLANDELAEYRIYRDGNLLATVPNEPLNTNSYQTPPGTFAPGSYTCTATAVTTLGVESAESNPVNFTVAPGTPKAPVFAVQ